MIHITHTVETTPHRAGDEGDSQYETQKLQVSFRELVALIRNRAFLDPSCDPPSGSRHEWLSTEPHQDYRTGEWERESIMFSSCNPFRRAKYWRKAMRAAGIIKGAV